jgi:hypothetical protein
MYRRMVDYWWGIGRELKESGRDLIEVQQIFLIMDLDITDFSYNEQNLAEYSCEFLEILRH